MLSCVATYCAGVAWLQRKVIVPRYLAGATRVAVVAMDCDCDPDSNLLYRASERDNPMKLTAWFEALFWFLNRGAVESKREQSSERS